MSTNDVQKHCFDKSKYKSIEEINQDTPASSASQLKNQV